jgi:hypothetical protein
MRNCRLIWRALFRAVGFMRFLPEMLSALERGESVIQISCER